MNKNNIWFITAKTNLHVGNENTSSYGLIDLAVQRNVTTELPCINSSSLKGALNEYAAKEAKLESKELIRIFGSDKVKDIHCVKPAAYITHGISLQIVP